MRILHVIPSMSPQRGGPSIAGRALADGLARAGLEVHVATTDDDGPGRRSVPHAMPLREGDVTYWYFPRQTGFYTASWPLAAWLARHVGGFDLVHAHALFSFAPLAAAAAATARRVPYIIRPLGTLSPWGMHRRRRLAKRLSFQLLDRHALAGAAAVHFTSEQERREATDLGVPLRSAIVPLPVELPVGNLPLLRGRFRSTHPAIAGRTLALFLSRIDPKKGLDLLLPALASAHAHSANLVLAIAGTGDPTYLAGLQARAAALGLADTIIWAGFLEGEARLAALADADLFVLPSYAENFAIAAVEAMAAGLPVIVSDQVGIQHEITAARAGLVVPCATKPLAAALHTLATNPALRTRMGTAARHLAATRFAPQAVIEQLIELYQSVEGRRQKAEGRRQKAEGKR